MSAESEPGSAGLWVVTAIWPRPRLAPALPQHSRDERERERGLMADEREAGGDKLNWPVATLELR